MADLTARLIPLNKLRFGHEAKPPINARRTGRDAELEALAASLAAHGQIQPLAVRRIAGKVYVADGNRRLAALRLRADRGEIAQDAPVKCDEDGRSDGEEISLAANVMRLPLHEADMYEAFRDLSGRGLEPHEIATRFGIEPPRVRRMLALGNLSPVILAAWREGSLGRDAHDVVKAFTLARSLPEQERVFAKLKKAQTLSGWQVRRELGAEDREGAKLLRFVTREAYEAAGGAVTEDLFGDHHVLSDLDLVRRLAGERFAAVRAQLEAEGWSWVEMGENLPNGWSYNWQTLKPSKGKPTRAESRRLKELLAIVEAQGGDIDEAKVEMIAINAAVETRTWSDEAKAKAGCVLSMAHNGDLAVTYGVLKPAAPKKDKPGKAKGEAGALPEKKEPAVSNALMTRLSVQATLGVRAALAQEPRLGLVALLAGFVGQRGPIEVANRGYGATTTSAEAQTFAAAFARLADASDDELFQVAAGIAGDAVDLRTFNAAAVPFRNGNGALAAAIDADRLQAAMVEAFDAADYFQGASRALVLRAIGEAVNADEARKAGALKKAELVGFAIENVPRTGWLPPELRCATYAGPGAAAPAQAEGEVSPEPDADAPDDGDTDEREAA